MPDLTDTGQLTSGVSKMSTMWTIYPRWVAEVDFYRPRHLGGPRDLLRLLRMARRHDVAILMGAVSLRHRYRDVVLAVLVKTLPRSQRPRLVIAEPTWEPKSRTLAEATKLPPGLFTLPVKAVVRILDGPHVVYGVLSEDEVLTFPSIWGVDPERVVFTPYATTMDPGTVASEGDHVFCGGDSLRDFATLEAAVRDIDVPVIMGCRWRPQDPDSRIQASYMAAAEYEAALATARMVVVPLQQSTRSAGQQTYLNAMLMGKPTIVSDTTGVRNYVEDGVTGVVVPPADPAALRAAIEHVLDPANAEHYRAMGRRAREVVLADHMDGEYFDETLIQLADG